MKEIEEFERKQLKKINSQYEKDKLKEQRLLEEYEKALEKEGKIKFAKDYRDAVELEDWKVILEEKKKLRKMI